ncbi:MAG TPA: DUF4406 domain-containing protein [Ruminococcaceae bacterium]|nr:DUF4406 domain-containing protein [Oscillospiraceae bacterium]
MNKIFVCSAFRGDTDDNIRKTKEYCRWIVKECGAIPIAPHLLFPQFLNDNNEEERQLGINMGLELLVDCNELYYFGDRVTQGMATEINKAQEMHIPVHYILENEIKSNQNGNGGFVYEQHLI